MGDLQDGPAEKRIESLGSWLRRARENRGLSLLEVEKVIRIRVRYLEALETGDHDAMLGGESQMRGFVRRYASFLGLSQDEAMDRLEHGMPQERPEVTPANTPRSGSVTQPPISAGAWYTQQRVVLVAGAVIVALLLIAGGWWLASRATPSDSGTPTPDPGTVSQVPSPLPSATSATPTTSVGLPDSPSVTPTFPVAQDGGVTLTLEPLEHVWVRVTIDGMTAFEGILSPGNLQTWTAEEMIVAETGNGAGVIAIVNGQVQGPLGDRGEISTRSWGVDGEL